MAVTVDYDDQLTAVSERECGAIAADAVAEVLQQLGLGEPSNFTYSCRSRLEAIALRSIQEFCNSRNKVTNRVKCRKHGHHAVRDFLRRNGDFLQPNVSSGRMRHPHIIERGSGIAHCTSIS